MTNLAAMTETLAALEAELAQHETLHSKIDLIERRYKQINMEPPPALAEFRAQCEELRAQTQKQTLAELEERIQRVREALPSDTATLER